MDGAQIGSGAAPSFSECTIEASAMHGVHAHSGGGGHLQDCHISGTTLAGAALYSLHRSPDLTVVFARCSRPGRAC